MAFGDTGIRIAAFKANDAKSNLGCPNFQYLVRGTTEGLFRTRTIPIVQRSALDKTCAVSVAPLRGGAFSSDAHCN